MNKLAEAVIADTLLFLDKDKSNFKSTTLFTGWIITNNLPIETSNEIINGIFQKAKIEYNWIDGYLIVNDNINIYYTKTSRMYYYHGSTMFMVWTDILDPLDYEVVTALKNNMKTVRRNFPELGQIKNVNSIDSVMQLEESERNIEKDKKQEPRYKFEE